MCASKIGLCGKRQQEISALIELMRGTATLSVRRGYGRGGASKRLTWQNGSNSGSSTLSCRCARPRCIREELTPQPDPRPKGDAASVSVISRRLLLRFPPPALLRSVVRLAAG